MKELVKSLTKQHIVGEYDVPAGDQRWKQTVVVVQVEPREILVRYKAGRATAKNVNRIGHINYPYQFWIWRLKEINNPRLKRSFLQDLEVIFSPAAWQADPEEKLKLYYPWLSNSSPGILGARFCGIATNGYDPLDDDPARTPKGRRPEWFRNLLIQRYDGFWNETFNADMQAPMLKTHESFLKEFKLISSQGMRSLLNQNSKWYKDYAIPLGTNAWTTDMSPSTQGSLQKKISSPEFY